MIRRMPIVLPATTALPNVDRMRTMNTQLVVLTRIWNTPVDDSRQMPRITAGSSRRWRASMRSRPSRRDSM